MADMGQACCVRNSGGGHDVGRAVPCATFSQGCLLRSFREVEDGSRLGEGQTPIRNLRWKDVEVL